MKYLVSIVVGSLLGIQAGLVFGQIEIKQLRIKEPIPGQSVVAGYLRIENLGDEPRVLRSVSSIGAETIELHTHDHDDEDVLGMLRLDQVAIAANSVFEFTPGGHHLMVFSPSEEAIKSGEIELVFSFANGEKITTTAMVERRN